MLLILILPIGAAEVQVVKGHVPRALAGLQPLRRLENTRRLDLAIGLPLRNREALTNLLGELYNPGSPNYRRYLTPQQFAERFGPTEAAYQAVVAFAKSNHLVVTGTHPNCVLLDVNGSVADIERALHLNLRVYHHPTEPRTFYSPDVEPSFDSRVPVLSISGLDDFFLLRPMDLRPASGIPALYATGSGPSGSFIGRDFRAAYAPGVSLDGSGESVGLVELDGYYPSDIAQYEALAGLPAVTLSNVTVNNFNRPPGGNNNEVALDIEMAISMAPGLSRVIVYEGTTANAILNRMATDNLARQLSCSWSFSQQVDPAREQIFQQFAAQGQSMFQASGDSGSYGAGLYPPADDPFVTAVGGTALSTSSPTGAWSSETAWLGSGGGVSPNYPIPAWQKGVSMASNQGSSTMRNVPDVACLADATIWVIANNGEQATIGGTSAAAPLWAGFAALVNQQAAAAGQPGIGFANPAIYAIGQGPVYASSFHDITSGNNTNSASPTRFLAVPGYDLCTGWGTPAGSNLIQALLAPPDALEISPRGDYTVSGPVSGPFNPAARSYSLTNSGAASIGWAIGNLPSWLNASVTNGALVSGGLAETVTLGVSAAATNLGPGSYTGQLWFTNLNDSFAQSRIVSLDVVTLPAIIAQPGRQTLPAGSTARFTVGTAANALLFYRWQADKTNLADAGNVSGSTTPTLTLTRVTSANNAIYSVVVSNAAGLATSGDAQLTVTSSVPVLVIQPASLTILPEATATFFAEAVGDAPLSYQWQTNGSNLSDSSNLSGSATSTLTLTHVSAANAKTYSVVVSNALGTASSTGAVLSVVSVTSPELAMSIFYPFTGGLDGGHPNGLTYGADRNLYGSTQAGGPNGAGTIFRLRTNGLLTELYSFTGAADGAKPNGGLLQDRVGNLFGTTYEGGTYGFGTIFRAGPTNGLTTLFSLDHADGVLPLDGLTLAADGKFYGTAYEGSPSHYGSVFSITTNGTLTTLVSFNLDNGGLPSAGVIQAADGNFYGTTYKGGAYGSGAVFKMTPSGYLTLIASFDGTNAGFPSAGLVQAGDGNFYGTTTYGGTFGLGTAFRVNPKGALTYLHSFSGVSDGSHPYAALLLGSDGNFYGTTADGGAYGVGTAFRMAPDGTLANVVEFDGYNGANPRASLTEGQEGSLYGATQNGGRSGQGLIFRFAIPASPPHITAQPVAQAVFQGAVVALAVASFGTAPLFYQWQKNGTNLTNAGNVSGATSRTLTFMGALPANAGFYSVIVSNAYGVAPSSAAGLQVAVSAPFITLQPTNQVLTPGSTAVLAAGTSGDLPLSYQWQENGTNVLDGGNVFGANTDTLTLTNVTEANNGSYTLTVTNALGPAASSTAVLSIIPVTAAGTRLTTLHWFTGGPDGRNASELRLGSDSYLYGTTEFGGSNGIGTIFRLATNGSLGTLISFNLTNGSLPLAGLVQGSDGRLYGTTSLGGSNNYGTVFAVDAQGALSTLHTFAGAMDGGSPTTRLIQGADGNFYGSANVGGAHGFGDLFEINSAGAFTSRYSFTGGADGNGATGALAQGPDGSFYGCTPGGGMSQHGSIFRLSPGGTLTTLYSFTGGFDGYAPVGALVFGDDGALYGATTHNTIRGFEFYGTLFKIATNGGFNTLYPLNFGDGSYPHAGLVQASDGNFYGTTDQGGANNQGTLFRMAPDGTLATLVEFDGFNDGANPQTALVEGPDAGLYGTTTAGGPGGQGTIFRLRITAPPQITGQPADQTAFTGAAAFLSVSVFGATPLFYQWQKNGTNLTDGARVAGSSTRRLALSSLTMADAGAYSVTVTNALGPVTSRLAALVITASPPVFQNVSHTNGTLELTWNAVAGRWYQLQFKPDLASANWTNTGNSLPASSSTLTVSTQPSPNAQGFYRVLLLPLVP